MFLLKLYTEPEELFQTVIFKNGVNFIFGKKADELNPKESLNGIGKSLLLDFINFCLLADFKKRGSLLRLHKAADIIGYNKIVLEFKVENERYTIKRDIVNSDKIEFGTPSEISEYTIKEIKPILCNIIFKRRNYIGYYSNQWLRKLIPFYIKAEQRGKSRYIDPIKYISECSEMELNQYHLFLMGIDNSLAYENFNIKTELKKKRPVKNAVEEFVRENYDLPSISDARNEADKLKVAIETHTRNIRSYKLADQYKDIENEANDMTSRIKDLLFRNYSDKTKLESYARSIDTDIQVNPKKIQKLYEEFNAILAGQIRKTLEDAIDFREKLSESRKDFLHDEIESIKSKIEKREQEIDLLEGKRSELFYSISSKEAIVDLSEAYYALNKQQEKLNNLESKIDIYTQLIREIKDLEINEKGISLRIIEYLERIKTIISEYRIFFGEIYNAIYVDKYNQFKFDIDNRDKTDAKLKIMIGFPADLSKGKNQGRTLVYDLFILFNSIKKGYNGPRFLIHDGIFDGMDKAHFVHLYEYLEEEKLKKDFQYIVTLNEEGLLNQKFGHSDKVTPEKIAQEAIIVLTPSKKLLGRDF